MDIKRLFKPKDKPTSLVFVDHSKENIFEVFGFDAKRVEELEKEMTRYLINNKEEGRNSERLERFINSSEFKRLGMKLETPNDFFLLSSVFFNALHAVHHIQKEVMDTMMKSLMGSMGPFGGMGMKKPATEKKGKMSN